LHNRTARLLFCLSAFAGAFLSASASDIIEVTPLTDQVVLAHFKDGHVDYHKRGESAASDKLTVDPLDVDAASKATSYTITSTNDPAFRAPKSPVKVGRKTKGTEFAGLMTTPNSASEHWLYLELDGPLKRGATYTVNTGVLAKNGSDWKFTFDETQSRSEAVHVNTIGYVPDAPEKFGYVYHWIGDLGSLDLSAIDGTPFYLIDTVAKQKVFTGKVAFRMKKENPETFQVKDSPPWGNYLNADVWECDFSSFNKPGSYVLAVEGVGASWPFRIGNDVYHDPYYHVTRALYHNRSGIALTKPYTDYERPAPHNVKLTPGFAGKLFYTTVREQEWGSEGGNADALKAGAKGPLENTWGWYQDAGDWDGYYSHLRVAQELLFAYEMAPGGFHDKDLNIPESGNGVPDILDEAAWVPRYCHRLRHELLDKKWGTGGVSLRVAGDAFGGDDKKLPDGSTVGEGSWEDVNRDWAVAGEDPWSTYRYAGVAAHLAYALGIAGVKDPEGVDWAKEAREAYDWAQKNTRLGDEQHTGGFEDPPLRESRSYAAAALFRLTGDPVYEKQFISDTADISPDAIIVGDARYGPWLYALGGDKTAPDEKAYQRIRSAVLHTADEITIATPSKRALRWGGNYYMPMLCGQQTTPLVMEGVVGYALTKDSDPEKARQYLAGVYTSCDYFLGTNTLNQTWIMGVGPRYPAYIFKLDAWYRDTQPGFQPGIIPYGPWLKQKDVGRGPWESDWANATLYPPIDQWPGNERWFSNRCAPLTSEFTVHQTIAPAAAIFGFLYSHSRDSSVSEPKR